MQKTMVMLNTVIALIVSSAIAASNSLGGSSYIDAIERCNSYVDQLLMTAVKKNNLESFPVYGREFHFKKKVVFYPFQCHANLTEGHVTGLGHLHRRGACSISFHHKRLNLHTEVETHRISFDFKGRVSAMGSTADVLVGALTSPLKIAMDLSFEGAGSGGSLDKYRPTVISSMSVAIDGLGWMEWVRQPLEENAEDLFFDLINTLTHHHLRVAVSECVRENPFPVGDLEASTPEPDVTRIQWTTPRGKEEYTEMDSNSYIDTVLANRFLLESKYSKLDPLVLSDIYLENVFVQIMQDRHQREANFLKLKRGELEHLSKVRRASDCTIPELMERDVTFTCSLGFEELTLKYKAEAHNGTQVHNFNLIVNVKETKLSLRVTSTTSDNVPTILDYSVDDVGSIAIQASIDIMRARMSSSSSLENLNNSEVILTFFSEKVNSILKGRFKDVLNYSIYKTPLPFLES